MLDTRKQRGTWARIPQRYSLNTPSPATRPPAPIDNLLLGALPEADYRRLAPHLEPVTLPEGRVISEPGAHISHLYFPSSGIVSLLTLLADGASTEIAIVGNDGAIGVSSFLDGRRGPGPRYRVEVTMTGQAWRLQADVVMKEFGHGGELQHWLLRYTQALITQIAQTAVCNRHHELEMQVSRWLLLRLDRLAGSGLHATHEKIANLLGVRREGVTEAASNLRSRRLIRYTRGHIEILDHAGLEQRTCECYGAIKREYARLLGAAHPPKLRLQAGRDDQACRSSATDGVLPQPERCSDAETGG